MASCLASHVVHHRSVRAVLRTLLTREMTRYVLDVERSKPVPQEHRVAQFTVRHT